MIWQGLSDGLGAELLVGEWEGSPHSAGGSSGWGMTAALPILDFSTIFFHVIFLSLSCSLYAEVLIVLLCKVALV